MSELWEKEEFEYSVTAALTAMYETDLFKLTRKVSPPYRVEPEELKWAKKIGPYFPARTAKCKPTRVSPLSLPQFATWAHTRILPQEENVITGYCSMLFVRKEKRLPSNVFKTGPGTPYSVYTYVAQEKGGIAAIKKYVTISDADGRVFETKVRQYDTFGHPFWEVDDRECFEGVGVISPAVVSAATSINLYSDRKNYWNVMAYEDDGARVLFGVEEEEVKSLFYSRSLPLTDTGRKRPILHWVAAHKRRLAAGTEIDIEKFLRGTNEFVMSGTKFMITRPERQPKGNELRMQPE